MRKIVLLAIAGVSFWAKAQTQRFIYDLVYKKDAGTDLLSKENFHLDIDSKSTTYYQRDFFVADSLINNNIPFPKGVKLNTSTIVYHKTGDDNYEEYDLMENTVLKLQTQESQQWNLENESKKVKDLTLQKATTTFGGRNWTAWFAKEIPFQEGPYVFHGLPGLIIELYDDKKNYKFELVKSVKLEKAPNNQFIVMARQMSVPVTWDKYKSTKLTFYESPVNFIKSGMGSSNTDGQFFLNDGTKVNPTNMREINERMKQAIKKYNNPINLDRKIVYP